MTYLPPRSRGPRLPKRKRLLLLAAGLTAAFAVAASAAAWIALRPGERYLPGQRVEGLTSELARDLPLDYPRVSLVDVTAEAGIRFRHFWGTRTSQLAEDMGSGAAWGDYNNDGWEDLFVVAISGPVSLSAAQMRESPARSTLYRNNGDGTFTDVTDQAGVGFRGIGMGGVWADYDNDGWLDLFVTAYGENTLYRNQGNGTFTDVTRQAGLGGRRGFWAGASWGDYDRDGCIDLYVTGYVKFVALPQELGAIELDTEEPATINPSSFEPERNLLYHNNCDATFSEVAAQAGVLGDQGRSLGAAWADFDGDGWPDLYIANDVSDNLLYRNLGNGKFVDLSHAAGVADYRSAMGLAIGDWNGDEALDIFITHWIAQENALYNNLRGRTRPSERSDPPLQFTDVADRYGLGQVALDYVGWGTAFFDYDNDGRLDLLVVNGHTLQQRQNPRLLVPMRDQLFWNRGPDEGFYDVSLVSGDYFRREYVGRGAALADYNNDGCVDVFIVNHGGPGILLRNDCASRNRWLKVQLQGTRSNRSAIGAKLRLVYRGGVQVREVGAQPSYLSGNSLVEHFGLGSEPVADSLVVTWPSGLRQVLTNVQTNQTVRIVEEAGSHERVRRFWELYRQATAARTAGELERAVELYQAALELNASHQDALYYLGSLQFELGHLESAERAWRRLIEANPASSRAHAQLGALYACRSRGRPFEPRAARAEFQRALEINPEETGPLIRLGELELLTGETRAARQHLTAVLRTNPRSVEAHFLLGYAAWREGNRGEAAAQLQEAARAAEPLERPAGVAGEGDTRSRLPLRRRTSPCPSLVPDPALLRRIAGMNPESIVDSVYRQVVAVNVF